MTLNPLTVVFCIPGNSFSGRFLECWTNLLAWCLRNGVKPVLSRKYSCNIYYARNLLVGGDVRRGPGQKPFNGQIQYSHIMWIDSDILFTPEQFARLLGHDADIVSGIYLMEGGKAFATVREWDEEYFEKNGCFQFLTPQDIEKDSGVRVQDSGGRMRGANEGARDTTQKPDPLFECPRSLNPQSSIVNLQLLEVAYTGMGFMLVKKGVFESLDYPWFWPLWKQIAGMRDFTMEDVGFCLSAAKKGWKVQVDTQVRVGHEKTVVF